MKLGGKYRLRDISARSWEKLSEELRMDNEEITGRVCEMARKLPVEAWAIRKRLEESGIKHPVLDRLTECLTAHAEKCERLFAL
jgi:serine/threonine-protein kinase HipA